jgi:uncharacterized membrane protein
MAIFSMDGFLFLLRWLHFMAGITWIGILYYFNFVQTPFFGSADPAVRSGMVRGLVPNALWWFRWGAMITFLTGWLIVLTKWGHQGIPLSDPYMTRILTGGLMGSLMWFNVWFVIWPAQQVVIASAEAVASGGQANPQAAPRGARSGLASRTNTLLSIPMLFFMGSASHLPALASSGGGVLYWIVFFAIVAAVEWNALVGSGQPRQKFLGTVRGTIHAGLGLTVLFYVVASVLA